MVVDDVMLGRYLAAVLKGDRAACRASVEELLQRGTPANTVYFDLIWPIMLEVGRLARADRISPVEEHLATRVNRTIVDQLQNKLPRRPARGKRVVICCGPTEEGEVGAQMMADLFEADGWQVRFIGGGLTNDDILGYINSSRPDILLVYGTTAAEAPRIRQMIDTIRGVDAWPDMKILLSGGLFSRARGLCEEIGGDLFADNAWEALRLAGDEQVLAAAAPERTIKRRGRRQSAGVRN